MSDQFITDHFQTRSRTHAEHTDVSQTLLYGSSEKPSSLTTEELRAGLGLSSGENISDYKSLYAIGVGGMGTVFGGYEPGLNRQVALKLLRPQYRNHADRIEDFIREARTTAQIDHPNIVPVHRLGVFEDVGVYFTMKKVAGETLQVILKNLRENTADYRRRYTLRQLLNIFLGCCHGVSFAHHHGILHCDLKPGNLMIGNYGETFVMDWGMARYMPELDEEGDESKMALDLECQLQQEPRDDKKLGGTWAFMAPELLSGKQEIPSVSTDIYALGAILYCILSWRSSPVPEGVSVDKHPAFICAGKVPSPRKAAWRNTVVPRELEAVCLKAMNFEPQERYTSVEELLNDVQNYLDNYPVKAYSPTPVYKFLKLIRRHPLIPVTLLAAVFTWCIYWGYSSSLERSRLNSLWTLAHDCSVQGNLKANQLKKQLALLQNSTDRTQKKHSLYQMRRQMYEMINDYSAALDFLSRLPEDKAASAEVVAMTAKIFHDMLALTVKFNVPSTSDSILNNITARWKELFALAAEKEPQLKTWVELIRNETGMLALRIPDGKEWNISIFNARGEYAESLTQEPVLCKNLSYSGGRYGFILPVGDYRLRITGKNQSPVFIPFAIELAQELLLTPEPPAAIPAGYALVLDGQRFSAKDTGSFRRISSKQLPSFFIGRYEVRFKDYIPFLKSLPPAERQKFTPKVGGKSLWDAKKGLDAKRWGELPVVGISPAAAQAFCEYQGKKLGLKGRLPTRDEWLHAAAGFYERNYVWGNETDHTASLTAHHPDAAKYPFGAPRNLFPKDESVYGVRNLSGNVREIVMTDGPQGQLPVLAGSSFRTPLFALGDECMNYGVCQTRDAGFRCLLELPQDAAK